MATHDEMVQSGYNYLMSIWHSHVGEGKTVGLATMFKMIPDAIAYVETLSKMMNPLDGTQKKSVVTDIVNKVVDLPIIPEFVEKALLGWLIDQAVAVVNRLWGGNWLESLRPKLAPLPEPTLGVAGDDR